MDVARHVPHTLIPLVEDKTSQHNMQTAIQWREPRRILLITTPGKTQHASSLLNGRNHVMTVNSGQHAKEITSQLHCWEQKKLRITSIRDNLLSLFRVLPFSCGFLHFQIQRRLLFSSQLRRCFALKSVGRQASSSNSRESSNCFSGVGPFCSTDHGASAQIMSLSKHGHIQSGSQFCLQEALLGTEPL